VWQERRNYNWDIYGYDLSTGTEFPICTDLHDQEWVEIYGNIVVWRDFRNGNWDIYGYDLSTGTEFPICTAIHDQSRPTIYEDTVVWWDERNGNEDIYGAKLEGELTPTPNLVPLLQTPDITKQMRPLASYRILQVKNLLEKVQKTCEKLKSEQDPRYTTCCADRVGDVEKLLKEAEKSFTCGNYIAANTFALKALELLQQICECCSR
jgi:beta propeller repeat protein